MPLHRPRTRPVACARPVTKPIHGSRARCGLVHVPARRGDSLGWGASRPSSEPAELDAHEHEHEGAGGAVDVDAGPELDGALSAASGASTIATNIRDAREGRWVGVNQPSGPFTLAGPVEPVAVQEAPLAGALGGARARRRRGPHGRPGGAPAFQA
jgi:hypothetical protein